MNERGCRVAMRQHPNTSQNIKRHQEVNIQPLMVISVCFNSFFQENFRKFVIYIKKN